jgi:hypothetical protein
VEEESASAFVGGTLRRRQDKGVPGSPSWVLPIEALSNEASRAPACLLWKVTGGTHRLHPVES